MKTDALAPTLVGSAPGLRSVGIIAAYAALFNVFVPALVWALGTKLDALLRLPAAPGLRLPGLLVSAVGLGLWSWGLLWLSAAGQGLPISSLPPARLVVTGPYALFRHPIYVGFSLLVGGVGCAAGSIGHGLVAPGILGLGCWAYVASFEGPALQRRYGPAYRRARSPGHWEEAVARLWVQLRSPIQRLANRPVLFRLGPAIFITYGLCVALGAFTVAFVGRAAVGSLFSPHQYVAFTLGFPLAAALGARLAALAYDPRALLQRGLQELRAVGFVSWGGYAGALAFTLAFGRAEGISALAILDRLLPLLFLCMVIGRVGCVSYGCCKGVAWEPGVRWTHPVSKPVRLLGERVGSVPRLPVQLLAALAALGAAAITETVDLAHAAVGAATSLGLVWYFFTRLGIEQLRDEPRFGQPAWTRGQWFALGGAGISLVLILALDPEKRVISVPMPPGWLALGMASVTFAIIFVIYGLHWRRVGRW